LIRTRETNSETETQRLAARLGKLVQPGDVLALVGTLGVGKTCFVQGLAKGLGVPARERVASPTFNIVLPHEGRIPLYHVDLYRMVDPGELSEIGLDHYLYGDGVCAVEWLDRFPELAPKERLSIELSIAGPRRRMLSVVDHGARAAALAQAWLDEKEGAR
jgi:tRNA threonylcarbamoyladenosine biosynthesis protein TsaE